MSRDIEKLVAPVLTKRQLEILRKNAYEDSKKIAAYIYEKNHGPHPVRPYPRVD